MTKLILVLIVCVLVAVPLLVLDGVIPYCRPPFQDGEVVRIREGKDAGLHRVVNMRWERCESSTSGSWEYDLVLVE